LLGSPAGSLYDAFRKNTFLSNAYRRFTDGGGVAGEEEERNRRNLAMADPAAARQLATDIGRSDHRDLLRKWRKPLYVIVADADAFVRIAQFRDQLASLAPNARLTVISGGHGWTTAYMAQQRAALEAFTALSLD
jgi:pimeloyl-ACP methyl ester carboxylesterase